MYEEHSSYMMRGKSSCHDVALLSMSIVNTHYNAQMSVKQIQEYCELDITSKNMLKHAMEKLNLSARAYDRILKVSRTIADLEGIDNILPHHISEAIQYRSLDREGWLG